MKRNLYVAAAAALLACGPTTAALAAPTHPVQASPAAVAASPADVTAEGAGAAALRNYPGVIESLSRDAGVWHVDVITKDGRGHAELKVDAASGKVTRDNVDTDEDSGGHKDLLAAKVTAEQALKAAVAAHPGEARSVEWNSDEDDDGNSKAASWHVEVRGSDGKTWDGSVDATTGKVTAQSDSDDAG
ncbi:PepSY domain-containing protein [Streptomyces sp. NPDC089915]|uniref:PepSY domain-containing protein n=1 Tax=Streptomyces sp. NPDC089915 TaxID=3155186 RepID=UPI003441E71B